MRGGGVRLQRRVERERERPVHQLPTGQVVPVDERDRDAAAAGPAGAADPVQVDALVLRALVVDDVGHAADVDAAGGDVGGHQHVDLAGPERAQRLLALALVEVAVHGGGGEASVRQVLGHLVRGAPGPHEHDRQPAAVGLQDPGQHFHLVQRMRAEDVLAGGRDGAALVGLLGGDMHRPDHEATSERDHRTGHRRREQHGLATGRQQRDDALHVRQETEVEHLVGLVEHQRRDIAQVERALTGEVQQTTRGADDDVDARAQGGQLRLVGPAAVHRQDAYLPACARPLEVGRDLDAQLTSRHDDERLRAAIGALVQADDLLDDGDAKTQRLAGAGARLADDVGTGERERERQLLDGEGVDNAGGREGVDRLLTNAEIGESDLWFDGRRDLYLLRRGRVRAGRGSVSCGGGFGDG